MKAGWISIHRKILDSPLWIQGTLTQKLLMIVLVMLAQTEARKVIFDGRKIMLCRGQLITSLENLVEVLGKGTSIQKVRTAIANLKRYGFLTEKVTKRGRLITVVNYSVYQGPLRQPNKQTSKELTTYNNKNKENKKIFIKDFKNDTRKYTERDYGGNDRRQKEDKFFKKDMQEVQ